MTSLDAAWSAPTAAAIQATVDVPGSKSQNNRELVLAALADSPTTLTGALKSRDSDLMIGALRALGASIDEEGSTVTIPPGSLQGPAHVDCRLAVTVMRLLLPIDSLAEVEIPL